MIGARRDHALADRRGALAALVALAWAVMACSDEGAGAADTANADVTVDAPAEIEGPPDGAGLDLGGDDTAADSAASDADPAQDTAASTDSIDAADTGAADVLVDSVDVLDGAGTDVVGGGDATDAAVDGFVGDTAAADAVTLVDGEETVDVFTGAPPGTWPDGAPTWKQIWWEVIKPSGCATFYCHFDASNPVRMLTEEDTYDALVMEPAAWEVCGLVFLVVPGNAGKSILWRRVRPVELDGPTPCLDKMPQGTTGLDPASAQLVYDWIEGGALP